MGNAPPPPIACLKGLTLHGRPSAQAGGLFSDAGMNTTDKRIIRSHFVPPRWLRQRHLQTVFPSLPWVSRKPPELRREILELPDGDATAIDWVVAEQEPAPTAPLLVILHGLESSAHSTYARTLMLAAAARGWHCCVLNFRDCGDYSNRLPRRYHAGETNDVRFFLNELARRETVGPMAAVGYSLGGNVLLKYLGEAAASSPLRAAAAVCVPLNLHVCATAINQGFSKFYQWVLIRRMKTSLRRKFNPHTAAFNWDRAMRARTFAEFDDAVTAPLHGFTGRDDYYDRCSASGFLKAIETPTLVINALDDPFMTPAVIPHRDRLSDAVTLEISEYGGHVGFIKGGSPLNPEFYLPGRLLEFLEPRLAVPGL